METEKKEYIDKAKAVELLAHQAALHGISFTGEAYEAAAKIISEMQAEDVISAPKDGESP